MKREIGSYFWLTKDELQASTTSSITPAIFGCQGSDYVWLSTCRSAISFVLKNIEERNPTTKRVCIPTFTCHTVIEPFLKTGYKIIPLPVEKSLTISPSAIEEIIEATNPGIVLLHPYFGFDTLKGLHETVNQLREKGIIVIEDVTQCLYSSFPRFHADYFVGSIRKWCGVPDGSFAVCTDGQFSSKPTIHDNILEQQKIEASLLKYQYIEQGTGDKDLFLRKYREAEHSIVNQSLIYNISPFSLSIQANINKERLVNIRRRNYSHLLNHLHWTCNLLPIFQSILDDEVPLYFPVYFHKRSELQMNLSQNNIYAPIVWPKSKDMTSSYADYIYDNIICIPIDQRYDLKDMEVIYKTINSYNSR